MLLLKNEVDELSLSVMEEIRLLVSLCGSVVHLIPKTELVRAQLCERSFRLLTPFLSSRVRDTACSMVPSPA